MIVVSTIDHRACSRDISCMKYGPDIARIAALIGDPARANILAALFGGMALTSSELAIEAGVTPQTVASHLSKLAEAGLIGARQLGRHRYWGLADPEVARLLEGMMGLAQHVGALRSRPGPKDPALRKARICYDHLAGEFGVKLHEHAIASGALRASANGLEPGANAEPFFAPLGIRCEELAEGPRVFCRECLDWSMRKSHLAGALGAACLTGILALGWARREAQSRVIAFTPEGERRFLGLFDKA
jgi:DNA-binding transcriptional ArsR family regulator